MLYTATPYETRVFHLVWSQNCRKFLNNFTGLDTRSSVLAERVVRGISSLVPSKLKSALALITIPEAFWCLRQQSTIHGEEFIHIAILVRYLYYIINIEDGCIEQ